MTRTILIAAALALAVTVAAVQAQAQAIRTFVSVAGSDSNPCTITQPCRHFQAAVNVTSAGGEVDALDAGAYGSFTISQAISIEGQGWSYVAPPNNGNAITINAGSGNVTIRGVSLNGVGATGGTNGIVFNSGGGLTITDCVIQNFSINNGLQTTGDGILMQPTSGTINFLITNTVVANNGFTGIFYVPTNIVGGGASATGVIDHVVTTNNSYYGIYIKTEGGNVGPTHVSISNSIASNNTSVGIYFIDDNGVTLGASVDNTSINNNEHGIYATGAPRVTLGRSVVTANSIDGVYNGTINTFSSYQDNRIDGNGGNANSDVTGTALSPLGVK